MRSSFREASLNNLKEDTLRGGLSKLCGQGIVFLIRLVFLVIMARLLGPEDFGLVAMVLAVTGIFEILATAGLGAAMVQKPTITDEEISTLFWINLVIGIALGLLCVAVAPLIAAFYNEPRLFGIALVMATGFVFTGAGVQQLARLQRNLRYFTLTAIEILAQVASISLGIGMAMVGYGYWALVASAIALPAATTLLMWTATSRIPRRPERLAGVLPLLRFGGTITLNNLVVHIGYNMDKLLIGRFWGADALGLYGRAWQLINIPNTTLLSSIGVVAFSALSRLQADPIRCKIYFIKGYTLVNALTLPTTMFCALFASDIVLLVLGPKWTDAAPIFRLLAPTILVFGIINPLGWLLQSIGFHKRSLKNAFVIAPLVIAGCVIGLPYGATGVALGFSGAMVLWLVPNIVWCVRGTMISASDLFLTIWRPLIASIIAGAIAFGLVYNLEQLVSPILRLLLGAGAMAGAYAGILLFIMGQKSFYFGLLKGLKLGRSGPLVRPTSMEEVA